MTLICNSRETEPCFSHRDCGSGLQCVVGYCGDPRYLDAIAAQDCTDDQLCEDLLLGPECCLDIGGGVRHLVTGHLDTVWGKRCCDNIRAPVTIPTVNMTEEVQRMVRPGPP